MMLRLFEDIPYTVMIGIGYLYESSFMKQRKNSVNGGQVDTIVCYGIMYLTCR